MYSHLFRRETARRLRAIADDAVDAYHAERPPWLNAYSRPDREAILAAVEMLAQSVAEGDIAWYREYADKQVEAYLAVGMPPIALLASSDLLFGTILRLLTADQRDLVGPILEEQRVRLQDTVRDCLHRRAEQVGA